MREERRLIYLDYNMISLKLESMIESIRVEDFESIVVIVRGGLFPAAHISVRTGLPMFYIQHDGKCPNWIGHAPAPGKILLVEDLAGSGHTLLDSQSFLHLQGYDYKTLVVWKDTISASTPDYICFETTNPLESFILPWEKAFKLNGKAQANSDVLLADHMLEFTGWDMDGIFLCDVPSEIYQIGLEHALLIRDKYPLAPIQPKLGENDIIITGRPTMDADRTTQWLQEQSIQCSVYFRDDDIEKPTAESTALWKGKKAVQLGCYRYVESDSAQAMHLAANFPQLEVVWWNDGHPITLQASNLLKVV